MGQKTFSIEQLIYIGGKKRNEIKLAQKNEELSLLEFDNLLRNLKLELRQSFYTVYYNSKNLETNNKQLEHLENLIESYAVQTQKGNIPLKDLVRLQSLYLNFKNERLEIINNTIDKQANLKLLMNDKQTIIPLVSEADFNKYTQNILFDISHLEQEAIKNRPDYLQHQKNIEANELNIKWQKALAIPDVVVGVNYDQRSGAFNNESNLSLVIPLPLWNKNKGNIKYATTLLNQSKVEKQNFELQMYTEIESIWSKWNEAKNNYLLLGSSTISNFETVYDGILVNFQKRNISLLEFTDFMESYNQASTQLNELKKTVVLSAEELNNTINTNLFKNN